MSVVAAIRNLENLAHECAPTEADLTAYRKDIATLRRAISGDLARAYAEAAEWNLATLAGFLMRKSTPKHETSRQMKICLDMLAFCVDMPAEVYVKLSRVQEILAGAANVGLGSALERWAATIKG